MRPAVYAGKPKDSSDYDKITVGALQVYVPKNVKTDAGVIDVDMMGKGIYQRLVVSGLTM
ncbi:hypothetical protein SY88_19755 [Clostridiales bacterium PH28_bin88]|nr:hypothetical protein SY88_19755 [Clostridiales bacterium PH28_bin88]